MKSRDELQNDYEEALFAIIMDDIMDLEGRALNAERKRLSESDEFKVPNDVYERCHAVIERFFKEADRKHKAIRARKIWRTILVAAIVMSILATSVCAIVPEVKEKVLGFFVNITEQIVHFSVSPWEVDDIADVEYSLGDALIEYELLDSGKDDYADWKIYVSKQFEDSHIYFIATYGYESTVKAYDFEDCVVEEITIGSFEGMLLYKNNTWQAALYDPENQNFLDITFVNISKDDVIGILNELRYQ